MHIQATQTWTISTTAALNLGTAIWISGGLFFKAEGSRRTLCDYTHIMSVNAGVSREIPRLKENMKIDCCDSSEKIVGVMLDENGVVFNRKTDKLVGFMDLVSINHDMEALQSSLTTGSWN